MKIDEGFFRRELARLQGHIDSLNRSCGVLSEQVRQRDKIIGQKNKQINDLRKSAQNIREHAIKNGIAGYCSKTGKLILEAQHGE